MRYNATSIADVWRCDADDECPTIAFGDLETRLKMRAAETAGSGTHILFCVPPGADCGRRNATIRIANDEAASYAKRFGGTPSASDRINGALGALAAAGSVKPDRDVANLWHSYRGW